MPLSGRSLCGRRRARVVGGLPVPIVRWTGLRLLSCGGRDRISATRKGAPGLLHVETVVNSDPCGKLASFKSNHVEKQCSRATGPGSTVRAARRYPAYRARGDVSWAAARGPVPPPPYIGCAQTNIYWSCPNRYILVMQPILSVLVEYWFIFLPVKYWIGSDRFFFPRKHIGNQ